MHSKIEKYQQEIEQADLSIKDLRQSLRTEVTYANPRYHRNYTQFICDRNTLTRSIKRLEAKIKYRQGKILELGAIPYEHTDVLGQPITLGCTVLWAGSCQYDRLRKATVTKLTPKQVTLSGWGSSVSPKVLIVIDKLLEK